MGSIIAAFRLFCCTLAALFLSIVLLLSLDVEYTLRYNQAPDVYSEFTDKVVFVIAFVFFLWIFYALFKKK